MTMISEYNAMQAPEANEHDAHAALAPGYAVTRSGGLVPVPDGWAHAGAAYDRRVREERERAFMFG